MLAVTLFLLTVSLVKIFEASGMGDAFCKSETLEFASIHFPIEPPARHLPWIWDAILSSDGSHVELTAISRNACKFSKSKWKKVARKFPEFGDQLGGGLDSSILAPVDNNYDYIRDRDGIPGYMGNTVICSYLLNGIVVGKITSRRINDEDSAEMSSIQIRCPVPYRASWTHIRIEREVIIGDLIDKVRQNHTVAFPVCGHTPNNTFIRVPKKKYTIAVCTATSRYDRQHLVEWLEFHKLMGIEHFYIYNTAPRNQQNQLHNTLSDYISEKNVTIVSWPYDSCVDGMASGRWLHWMDGEVSTFFQPPRVIAQTAALASCYSRYKSSTEWMAHIDDDEFLSFNFGRRYWGKRLTSLLQLVQTTTLKLPKTRAIYFKPLHVMNCPEDKAMYDFLRNHKDEVTNGVVEDFEELSTNKGKKGRISDVLPRFGKWQTARLGVDWEGKMIMRTDAVGMFFVHYITLREPGEWDREAHQLDYFEGAVLHYKTLQEDSGSIFGAYLPFEKGAVPQDCRLKKKHILAMNVNATILRKRLTSAIVPYLEKNYISRMNRRDNKH